MATVTVSSTNQLLSALKSAKGGDVIKLKAGNYDAVYLDGLNFDKPVTITSDDPKTKAVITRSYIEKSSGIVFQNLEFFNTWSNTLYPVHRVVSSSNITFDRAFFHGTLDNNPATDGTGLQLDLSKNISIINSQFRDLRVAMLASWSSDITLSNNIVQVIREDGFKFGGTSNVLIKDNLFTDFRQSEDDHRDAIQFMSAKAPGSASNITIVGNVIVADEGLQGIFLRDEVGTMPYLNVTIANNTIYGSNWNAIAVLGGVGVDVKSNSILGTKTKASWIRLDDVKNVNVTDNSAPAYNVSGGVNGTNKYSKPVTDALTADVLSRWFQQHGAGFGDAASVMSDNLGVKISLLSPATDAPLKLADAVGSGGGPADTTGGQPPAAPAVQDKTPVGGNDGDVPKTDLLVCVSPVVVDRQAFSIGATTDSGSPIVTGSFALASTGEAAVASIETRHVASVSPFDIGLRSGGSAAVLAAPAEAEDTPSLARQTHERPEGEAPTVAPVQTPHVETAAPGPSPLAVALAEVRYGAHAKATDPSGAVDQGVIAAFVREAVSAPSALASETLHEPIEQPWHHHTVHAAWSLDFF